MKKDYRETLLEIQEKYTGFSWSDRTTPSKIILSGLAVLSFLDNHKSLFGFGAVGFAGFVIATVIVPSTHIYERPVDVNVPSLGTGGPDFVVLGSNFSYADASYVCNDEVWGIGSGADRTIVYYGQGTSTPLGSTFQIDFIPTGLYATNLAIARPELYEVIPGDNTFYTLSLKDLRSGDFISLKSAETGSRFSKSVSLDKRVSTTSLNTIRIEEVLTSKLLRLVVTINNEVFVSDEILISNEDLYKSLSFALLDTDELKQNETGIFFPELTICS